MPARAGAFSLLEMMVVVTVLGILVALVVPQFGGTYQEALLRAAGRELLAVMNLAHSQAITSRRSICLSIEPALGRYRLESTGRDRLQSWGLDAGAGDSPGPEALPGAAGRIDPRISIEVRQEGRHAPNAGRPRGAVHPPPPAAGGPAARISFHPDGTADACELLLRDEEGARLALRIQPVTARVELRRLGKEIGS